MEQAMTIITIETDRGSTKFDRRKYGMFPGGVVVGQSLKVIELDGPGDKGDGKNLPSIGALE